jgi:hypothetical protein
MVVHKADMRSNAIMVPRMQKQKFRARALKENPDFVIYLWDIKLKSRACFLLIIQYMNVKRKQLKSIMPMMEKFGESFFSKYIETSIHFFFQGVRTTSSILGAAVVPTNEPTWSPSSD